MPRIHADKLNATERPDDDRSLLEPGESFVKNRYCPECGAALFIAPCRACKVRKHLASGLVPPVPEEVEDDL